MNNDFENIIQYYSAKFQEYGYSPKSLGWDKGKQDVRFEILTSQYNFEGKKVLDIGCGFGDLIDALDRNYSDFQYTGVDLLESFVKTAQSRHLKHDFLCGNILDLPLEKEFDYAIASGTFNLKLKNNDNYFVVDKIIEKTLSLCKDGLAFDFLSDKVDYQLPQTFHFSPEKMLSIAYKYSRNVVFRNDYMPFEFALFIFKNDCFEAKDTLFCKYKNERNYI